MKMLRVVKKSHAAFWENLWAKAGPNRASIDSSEKRIMLDYQLIVLLVKVVRTTFSENSEPVWEVHVRIHVAPLACYTFINIKWAPYHLLLHVVYLFICAKNHKISFIHWFVTSKNVKWCHLIWPTLYELMLRWWVPYTLAILLRRAKDTRLRLHAETNDKMIVPVVMMTSKVNGELKNGSETHENVLDCRER